MKPKEGQVIGKYVFHALLGSGGQGNIYAAEHTETQRRVAIKILSLETMDTWKSLELFGREAAALESIHHSHIPRFIDYFSNDQGEGFLVQDLIEGDNLLTFISSGRSLCFRSYRHLFTHRKRTS